MNQFDPPGTRDLDRPGCEPARLALQRLLDGDTNWDDAEAASHRTGCIPCREELVLANGMVGAVRPALLPAGLADRLVGAATSDRRRRRLLRLVGGSAALAASVLIAVAAVRPTPQTLTEQPTLAKLSPPRPEPERPKPLGESVAEAREALAALSRRAAAETRQTSGNLIPNPDLPDMPGTGDRLEPLADVQTGAARSVDPIKSSARRALNLFLRAADPPNKPVAQ
jgi:hypothetical protein